MEAILCGSYHQIGVTKTILRLKQVVCHDGTNLLNPAIDTR